MSNLTNCAGVSENGLIGFIEFSNVFRLTRRMKTGFLVSIAALLVSSATVFAQPTVGDWNLSPWVYSGTNFSTSTVNSNGSTPVGLSATVNSSGESFFIGETNGSVVSIVPFQVPPFSVSTNYQLTQSFLLSAAVDFGMPSTQSQFVDANTDNGIGIRINSESAIYITSYNLTVSLTGGGVFSSVGGDFDGFGNLTGLGTNTIAFQWTAASPVVGEATFDGIQISGGITGFSVTHDLTYNNNTSFTLDPDNLAEIKIDTTELTAGMPGDFNDDKKVDAADYVLWRDNDGSATALPNDDELGTPIRGEHYDLWQASFGGMEMPSLGVAIPEPEGLLLAAIGLALLGAFKQSGGMRGMSG